MSSSDINFTMDYRKAKAEAEMEVAVLLRNRARIDARLSLLKALIENCTKLVGEDINKSHRAKEIEAIRIESGITNATRQVLRNSKVPLSAPEIMREAEKLMRVDLVAEYVNPWAVFHNTLTRLEKQGEVMRMEPEPGRIAYAAVPIIPPPPRASVEK
jgi:hypothetical protein